MEESAKRGLLEAYGRLLAPLLRILIRNGVSFSEFSNAAKEIYVDVAATSFNTKSGPAPLTRTAILAGLPAEEVREILEEQERVRSTGLATNLNHVATVLSAWHTDSDFTGPYGVPMELQFKTANTFGLNELVRRHIGNVKPEPLVKELIAVGAVRETEKGWFKALTRFYMPKGAAPAGIDHLSRSVQEFVGTLDHNSLETDPNKRMFERQIYTADGIKQEDIPRFKEFSTSRAKILLEEIDNWLSHLDPPDEPENERVVTGLGIYHYITDNNKNEN
jgi:hypothetical protein